MPVAETRASPSLSDGAHSGGGKGAVAGAWPAASPSSPDKPAVTPIPGAFWLLGSGLAGLLAVKRGKRMAAIRMFHRNRNRADAAQALFPHKPHLTQPAQCSREKT